MPPEETPRPERAAVTMACRVGIGYDSHRFAAGRKLILGGVEIPDEPGLDGHSDADAICHALTDAILGAAGLGDIGEMFPDTDPANRGRDSIEMLAAAVDKVARAGHAIGQVDVTLIAEQPKLSRYRSQIQSRLGPVLRIDPANVSVKGKSNEGMGWIGRGEGLACIAVATLEGNR